MKLLRRVGAGRLCPIFALVLLGGLSTAAATELLSIFPNYRLQLTDRQRKNPNLFRLEVEERPLVTACRVFLDEHDGRRAVEGSAPEYEFSADTYTSQRSVLGKQDGEAVALASRTLRLTAKQLTVAIAVKVHRPLTLASGMGLCELLQLPVSSLRLVTLEAVSLDGHQTRTIIPPEYDKAVWGYRHGACKEITLILEDHRVVISSADASIFFNHYGGREIEISVRPRLKSYKLTLEAEDVLNWNYYIAISKITQ